jgi:cardiolipin synthase
MISAMERTRAIRLGRAPCGRRRAGGRRARWVPWAAFILSLLGGCHTPPADPAGGDTGCLAQCRGLTLARQVVADSAVTVAARPVQCGGALVADSLDELRAAGQGFLDKRLLMRLWGPPTDASDGCGPSADGVPCAAEARGPDCPLKPAHVRLLIDGAEALAALDEVIAAATCRIDVLMYMWDQTTLGEHIARRLAARARPGLRVRVLVDGGGNLTFGEPEQAPTAEVNRVVCWLAAQPYVELLRTRNPCGHFDHRKLVVADGRLAWTGGRNFTQNGFLERHDVSLSVAGPLAADLDARFEEFWRNQGGRPAEVGPALVPPCVNGSGYVVATDPGRHGLEHALYEAVDEARQYVYVENPYISDSVLVYKLARARRRGADVRVVTSVDTDTPSTNAAMRVVTNRLLRAGVRVYLCPGSLHAKAAIVDGCWLYLGSGNFDPLSLRRNHELGLIFRDGPVLGEAEQRLFLTDFHTAPERTDPLPVGWTDYGYELLASLVL